MCSYILFELIFKRTSLFNFIISCTFLGCINLYFLNSFFVTNLINFFVISEKVICLFKKDLTNSSLAETNIVSNNESIFGSLFLIFTTGNFFKSTFFSFRLINISKFISFVLIFFLYFQNK